jgi:hypothetical protein
MTTATYATSAPRAASDKPTLSVAKKPKIPALEELKSLAQWVLWRLETRGLEPTKVPYDAGALLHHNLQRGASSTEPATWSTFEEAQAAYRQHSADYTGVGFVFKRGGGLAGVDLDDCLDERGQLLDWARPLVEPFLARGAYAEVSPSGRGLKLFVRASVPHPDGEGLSHTIRDEHGQKLGKLEIYSEGRYFTVTGRRYHLAGDALVDCQEPLSVLYLAHKKPGKQKGQKEHVEETAPDWTEVARIDARELLGRDGIPFRLSEKAQTRKLLADALARQAFKKARSNDTDWSVLRWIVCKGLVLVGYPDDEIAAIMWHFESILNGSKRTRDFLADVARVTADWRAEYPHIKPQATRLRRHVDEEEVAERMAHVADEPRKSRARKDRPQKVAGAAGYLEWLRSRTDAGATILASQPDLARELGISERTLQRYERQLVEAGQVERVTHRYGRGARSYSYLVLLSGDNIPPEAPQTAENIVVTAEAPERIATPQNDSADAHMEHAAKCSASAPAPPAVNEPQAPGQEEPSPRVPSPGAPAGVRPRTRRQTLDALVVEALEACADDERVREATGEVLAGRASWSKVLEHVNAGSLQFAETAIRSRYDYWLKKRRWLRQIAKLRRDVPLYRERKLYGLSNWCVRIMREGEEEPRYPVASQYYDVIEAELERRATLKRAVLAREPDMAERPRGKKHEGSAVSVEELPLFLSAVDEVMTA